MSAQAVLSMIASAMPATPRGPSGIDSAASFRGLLSGVLSGNGEDAARPMPTDGDSSTDGTVLTLTAGKNLRVQSLEVLFAG